MPNPAEDQRGRREAIRQLLSHEPADTQRALVDALVARGFIATQSSVSRDLKEIGAIKTPQGYRLPDPVDDAAEELESVSGFIRGVTPAGPNLIVIKTAIGAAQRVALALDRSQWPEMVGNIGGDDTVFVATDSSAGQRALINRIDRART